MPSLTIAVAESDFSDCVRTRDICELLDKAGDCRLRPAMLPGRVLLVLGVRARRGRSVGGRGAGPGFMNWSREYMLACRGEQGCV